MVFNKDLQAPKFYGDGSGLTGIGISQIVGGVSGSLIGPMSGAGNNYYVSAVDTASGISSNVYTNAGLRVSGVGSLGVGSGLLPEQKLHVRNGSSLFENDIGLTLNVRTHVGNGNDAHINLDKSRGGAGTATTSLDGDSLGTIGFRGYTANGDYSPGAQIRGIQVGACRK